MHTSCRADHAHHPCQARHAMPLRAGQPHPLTPLPTRPARPENHAQDKPVSIPTPASLQTSLTLRPSSLPLHPDHNTQRHNTTPTREHNNRQHNTRTQRPDNTTHHTTQHPRQPLSPAQTHTHHNPCRRRHNRTPTYPTEPHQAAMPQPASLTTPHVLPPATTTRHTTSLNRCELSGVRNLG